jgi:hypothetical protein
MQQARADVLGWRHADHYENLSLWQRTGQLVLLPIAEPLTPQLAHGWGDFFFQKSRFFATLQETFVIFL